MVDLSLRLPHRCGGLGVFVEKSTIKRGLAVTSVVAGSWSDMCGLVPGDTILSLNSSPAESPQDIRNALADPSRDEISFVVCNAVGTNFRFNLPLPLLVPEVRSSKIALCVAAM